MSRPWPAIVAAPIEIDAEALEGLGQLDLPERQRQDVGDAGPHQRAEIAQRRLANGGQQGQARALGEQPLEALDRARLVGAHLDDEGMARAEDVGGTGMPVSSMLSWTSKPEHSPATRSEADSDSGVGKTSAR